MLKRIYIDNFKCFTNFEWEPGRLVLLAGRNGSGKTSVAEAITAIARVLSSEEELEEAFPESSLTRWDQRKEQRFELDVALTEGTYRYVLRLDHAWKADRVRVAEECLTLDGAPLFRFIGGEAQLYRDNGSLGPKVPGDWTGSMLKTVPERNDNKKLCGFRDALRRFWLLQPDPRRIESEWPGEETAPEVGLGDFVAWFRHESSDTTKTQSLNERLRPVLKDFAGLRLETTGRDRRLLRAVFQRSGEEGARPTRIEFDFDELSDGERMLIVLYSILEFGPVRDGLLCLDEPDNYLALEEIEPWLRELEVTLEEGDGQVFLLSHSPEVINRLWGSHGVWFERDGLGPVRVRPLESLEGLSPSELMARGWS